MKKTFSIAVLLLVSIAARATLYTQSFSGGTISDGSPAGQVFTGSFTTAPSGSTVSGLTVNLNLSGGYNGDLYAYLVAPDGTMVVLLNQPGVAVNGFGASGAGMNVTLADGYTSIQTVISGDVLSGNYGAAGTLSGFNGAAADGNWQLFFADLSNGGGTSTLNNWALNITAVPEPVNLALATLAGGAIAFFGFRRLRQA